VSGRELLERHVRSFNHGVRTADWEPMLALFADDAELRFENVPAGPFVWLDAIREGYREQPPDDEIVPLGVQENDEHTVACAFAWTKGGTGRLTLEHERGAVKRLTVVFDESR
jgi:hypothetical protein